MEARAGVQALAYFRGLTRIIHEADIVCHNINGRQKLRLSHPKHRVREA